METDEKPEEGAAAIEQEVQEAFDALSAAFSELARSLRGAQGELELQARAIEVIAEAEVAAALDEAAAAIEEPVDETESEGAEHDSETS